MVDIQNTEARLLWARYGGKVAGLIWIRFAFFSGARYYLSWGHDNSAVGPTQDRYYLRLDVH